EAHRIVERLGDEVKKRIHRFDEAAPKLDYFFAGPELPYSPRDLLGKAFATRPEEAIFVVEEIIDDLEDLEDWESDALLEVATKLAERRGLKRGDVLSIVRIAITGRSVSLPLTETMEVLGKRLSQQRLRVALDRLREAG